MYELGVFDRGNGNMQVGGSEHMLTDRREGMRVVVKRARVAAGVVPLVLVHKETRLLGHRKSLF